MFPKTLLLFLQSMRHGEDCHLRKNSLNGRNRGDRPSQALTFGTLDSWPGPR